jgi:hypothetical protein
MSRLVLLAVLSSCYTLVDGPDSLAPDSGAGTGVGVGDGFIEDAGFFDGGGCGTDGVGGSSGGGPGGGLDEVIAPANQPPPISGGTLAVLSDQTVVAADSDRDEVWLLPPGSMTPVRVALEVGDEPGRVVEGPTGHAFVALRRAGKVAELDVAGRAVVARHAACGAPRGLAWSGSTLSVACATGELTQLIFQAGAVATSTTRYVVDDLRDVVVDATGNLLLSTFRSAKLYRADGTLVVTAPGIGDLAAQVAWRLIPGLNGPYLLFQQEQVSGLSVPPCGGGGYGSPQASSAPGPVRAVFAAVGATLAQPLPPQLSLVVDIAVSADGTHLAFASPGAGMFSVAGGILDGVAGVGQPVSVAYRGQTLVVQSREPAALFLVDGTSPPHQIALSNVSRRATGHDLFHLATPSHIACASCHPEASDDGHVWTLPEGVRRTPTLRGGLSTTLPFHWDGAMTSMGKLVDEIMVKRMGGAPQSPNRVQALLDWLDSVPKQAAPVVDAAAAARGEALFKDAVVGCASCHAGPLGTNNQTVSVGTGEALQVPRLVELAGRAPYFHDGRVPSLEARFTAAGGTAHGDISKLTAVQVADLVAYLRTR